MSLMEALPNEADYLFELGVECASQNQGQADYVAAHKWFNLAASLGHPNAREARTDMALFMTAAEVAEAQRQARAWCVTH